MAWIAIQDRLPTGDRISNWNIVTTTSCCLCPATLETRNHMFFQCSFSEEIWRNLTHKLLSGQYISEWDEVTRLINDQTRQNVHLFLLRYMFQATLSTVWYGRNGRRHREKANPPAAMIKQIDKLVRNRISSLRMMEDRKYKKALETWSPFDDQAFFFGF